MSKFNKILKNSLANLLEAGIQDPNNSAIKQAVDVIDKALNNSGQVNANANAKALTSQLFGTSTDDSSNPLHSAFDKIKQNPDNPNLEDHEKEAFLSVADKLKPKEQTQQNTSDKNTSSKTSENTSEQPNATQYNPLNQPSS
jgi:hypothetical protein